MSDSFPERPPQIDRPAAFAIVASEYNATFVGALVDHARNELAAIYPNATVNVHRVPGAYEIPVVVQEVALAGRIDAIIALGVIIQGSTKHAGLIGSAITDALLRISLDQRVPVIHEVLLLDNETQARERCIEEKLNRGTEAARAASRVAEIVNQLKGR